MGKIRLKEYPTPFPYTKSFQAAIAFFIRRWMRVLANVVIKIFVPQDHTEQAVEYILDGKELPTEASKIQKDHRSICIIKAKSKYFPQPHGAKKSLTQSLWHERLNVREKPRGYSNSTLCSLAMLGGTRQSKGDLHISGIDSPADSRKRLASTAIR